MKAIEYMKEQSSTQNAPNSSDDPSSPTASQDRSIETESQSSRSVQRLVRCSESQSPLSAKPIVLDLSAPICEQNEARQKITNGLLSPDRPTLHITVKGLTTEQIRLLSLCDWSKSSVLAEEWLQTVPNLTFEERA